MPEVIQDGKIIHYTENHKDRGYDTYIIAAPIYVRSEKTGELARQYVGAVVKRDGNSQRFYLHEVMTEKEPASPITTGASNTGLPNGEQTLSIKSILQQALNVNHEGAYASKEAPLASGQWGETPGKPGLRSSGASSAVSIPQNAENRNVNGAPTDGILRSAQDDSGRQDGGAAALGFAERYGYGEHGRSVLNDMIESGSVSPDAVNQAFHLPYLWGMSNKARSEVELLGPIQEEAFNAGRLDRILSMKRSADTVTVWGKKSGLVENDLTKKLPRQTRESLHAMGSVLGAKIVVEHIPAEQNANGYYKSSDGTIHIDAETSDPVMTVAKHEITHRMQELAPEAYTQFRDYAVQMENRGAETGNLSAVEVKQEQYRQVSGGRVSLAVEEAMDEIAANYTEKILRDEKTLHDFVTDMSETEKKRSVGQKFFDAVHEFLRKLKEHFGKGKKARAKMDAEAVDAFGATVSELERAERLWKKAYGEAVQAAESEAGQARLQAAQSRDTMGESRYAMKGDERRDQRGTRQEDERDVRENQKQNTGGAGESRRTQKKDGGSGAVPSGRRQRGLNPSFGEQPVREWTRNGIVVPMEGSAAHREQLAAMEYGIPSYAKENGVSGNVYIDFLNTLDEVDQPTESGKLGTYTQDEAEAAIRELSGISNADRAILWQSMNKSWKEANNPWRRYLP